MIIHSVCSTDKILNNSHFAFSVWSNTWQQIILTTFGLKLLFYLIGLFFLPQRSRDLRNLIFCKMNFNTFINCIIITSLLFIHDGAHPHCRQDYLITTRGMATEIGLPMTLIIDFFSHKFNDTAQNKVNRFRKSNEAKKFLNVTPLPLKYARKKYGVASCPLARGIISTT